MDNSPDIPFLRNSEIFRIDDQRFVYPMPTVSLRPTMPLLSSEVAERLYQSIRRSEPEIQAIETVTSETVTSETNSYEDLNTPTCRICRYVSPTDEIVPCPCKCTGTVGFIHLKCLHRWIRVKRTNLCEICKQEYNTPVYERKYLTLFAAFFRPRYLGVIVKDMFNFMSVTPLVYFTVNQLVETMEATGDQPTIKLILIGPTLLLATSVYFFFYFDWALSCVFRMRNVVNHWWSFGDQDDGELDEFFPDFNFEASDFFELEF